jgi:hypothetical protein
VSEIDGVGKGIILRHHLQTINDFHEEIIIKGKFICPENQFCVLMHFSSYLQLIFKKIVIDWKRHLEVL